MSIHDQIITITYGDHAENHRGMQIISSDSLSVSKRLGLAVDELDGIGKALAGAGFGIEMHHLNKINLSSEADSGQMIDELPSAAILIIRGGINKIIASAGKSADDMYAEQIALTPDKKILVNDKVIKKVARWNLCYSDIKQDPDIQLGRGTVIPWSEVPLTNMVRRLIEILHPKLRNLVGEGNFYYNPESCGIRPHGDLERSVVVAARLGASMPLFYQWFNYGRPMGNELRFDLNHGDMYIMSACAVGTDNATTRGPILKHWACGPKFRI